MIIIPIFIPTSSDNSGPFILGTKNLTERSILTLVLFLSGLATSIMTFYTGTVLDNLGSKYFADEPSRLLSVLLPKEDFFLSFLSVMAPAIVAIVIALIVAASEKAYARILGWVSVVALLTLFVMGFIPA